MSLDSLTVRCQVALALSEPMYLAEQELRDLAEHVQFQQEPPEGVSRYEWRPDLTRFMGVEVVVDADRALLQANRYGMTRRELDEVKARRDAERRSRMDAILRRIGRPQ